MLSLGDSMDDFITQRIGVLFKMPLKSRQVTGFFLERMFMGAQRLSTDSGVGDSLHVEISESR
jgi:hypothetical protein